MCVCVSMWRLKYLTLTVIMADFVWNYSNYGVTLGDLVPDFSITNEIDESQPSLEASVTEEFYQNYGLGTFGNSIFYLQYRRALL